MSLDTTGSGTIGTAIRAIGLATALVATVPILAFAQARLTVEGTEFVLATADGRILRSADLIGATLRLDTKGGPIAVTIAGVEVDPRAVGGRLVLHHLIAKDDAGQPADLCAPDADGRSLSFPVPDGLGGFDLACTSGAVGKCVRWGYRPWEEQSGGPPLRALHRACVRMARADYGGDGHATTREGVTIYICDRFGVRPCAAAPLTFEAAWGPEGAVCVARPRVAGSVSLAELGERYPGLAGHLGPAACSEAAALRNPAALLFNRSEE